MFRDRKQVEKTTKIVDGYQEMVNEYQERITNEEWTKIWSSGEHLRALMFSRGWADEKRPLGCASKRVPPLFLWYAARARKDDGTCGREGGWRSESPLPLVYIRFWSETTLSGEIISRAEFPMVEPLRASARSQLPAGGPGSRTSRFRVRKDPETPRFRVRARTLSRFEEPISLICMGCVAGPGFRSSGGPLSAASVPIFASKYYRGVKITVMLPSQNYGNASIPK